MSDLAALAHGLLNLERHITANGLDHFAPWLPPQDAFLRDPSRRKLARWGNQAMGKSTIALAEVIYRSRGHHPHYLVPPPPIKSWVICASWKQSLEIQSKLWDLLPRSELTESTRHSYNIKTGFGHHNPVVVFNNGSTIRIATTGQRALDLAGATIHVALFDEPPRNARVYGEVVKRLTVSRGTLLLALTPINADCSWLRTLCEDGLISDHHYRLVPENLVPVGQSKPRRLVDGTLCDAAWIAEVESETLPHERSVVCHGEWDCSVVDSVFSAFHDDGPTSHIKVNDELINAIPDKHRSIRLGIDHGSGRDFSQCALLVVVDTSGDYDKVHVLDEWVSLGETTSSDDARQIVKLLERNGLEWRDLDKAYGDRAYGGKRTRHARKSNGALMGELAKTLDVHRLPVTIRTVKRGSGHGRGSVHAGSQWLHQAMLRPGSFTVHPFCKRLIESLQRWQFDDSEWKHMVDCARYSCDDRIFRRTKKRPSPAIYVY